MVATVPTACGIETGILPSPCTSIEIVATVPTACGIETLPLATKSQGDL